ncbi:MAG: hypothetical protein HW407_479 [Bacteroidetes bacterium]|nr:hypothetical protein [Bacteroidota bacterium]
MNVRAVHKSALQSSAQLAFAEDFAILIHHRTAVPAVDR